MKKVPGYIKRAAALSLALMIFLMILPAFALGAETSSGREIAGLPIWADIAYSDYQADHASAGYNGDEIILLGTDAAEFSGSEKSDNYNGRSALVTGEESRARWDFHVLKTGLYRIEVEYRAAGGTGSAMERALYIDGQLPFGESYNIQFSRVFRDDGEIAVSPNGDDFRPPQSEVIDWRVEKVRDQFGYFGEALYYYLPAGAHSLTLLSLKEPMAVSEIRLISRELTYPTYADYLAEKRAAGAQVVSGVLENGIVTVQAEDAAQKSHSSLYPVNDNTSPYTYPYDTAHKKLNAMGGLRWSQSGQWITWEISVPETGLYQLGARSKQNIYRDMTACRSLYIDGEIPFQEAADVTFTFSDRWKVETIGSGQEGYLLYLTKGRHEITLSVSLGGIKDVLMHSAQILTRLNDINLQLIALMGTQPDTDRDYRIDVFMPELIGQIRDVNAELQDVRAQLLLTAGNSDEMIAQIDQLIFQTGEMAERPDRIAELFGLFRESIRVFGNWIMEAREQPLLLDYLFVCEEGAPLPKAEPNFFQGMYYGFESFLSSFTTDYTSLSGSQIGSGGDKAITVWIGNGLSGGRDQAAALNKMIVEDFSRTHGILVNLQLVPNGTILAATLAGTGPDVALQLDGGSPVNYAMRNALYDLARFEDYKEIAGRFPASAMVPFEYNGGVYALPETFSFPMLFYRTDILRDLNISPDAIATWDDVIRLLPTLQQQNMTFGLFPDMSVYSMFLYQMGGSYYNADGSASALDSRTAIDAFTFWMEFYTNYGLERDFSFVNRFRTGEMPIGIADYTTYNLLSVSAPEIKGLWGMALLPGMKKADGSVQNVAPSGGAGAVIMNAAQDPAAAWEFLKWWTSADVQYRYGTELEAVMGTGARYNTANMEAFSRLPWSAADRKSLLLQMDLTQGTPQVPGGYYTSRYLDFAKIAVYDQNQNPKDTLLEYVDEINGEIRQKRLEFGLQ